MSSLARCLDAQGLCRVEEREDGIFIRWINNTPEAIRRSEITEKRERLRQSEKNRTNKELQEQVARGQASIKKDENEQNNPDAMLLATEESRGSVKIQVAQKYAQTESFSGDLNLPKKENVFAAKRKVLQNSRPSIPVGTEGNV